MLNDSRTSGSRPGGVLIPMPRARLPAALESRLCAIAPISKPHQPPMPSRLRNVVRRYLPAAHAAHGCVAVVLCSVLVAACGKTDPALDNDAYVWQRRWTPAVTAAMTDSADLVRAWRVLAADVAPDGKWSDATPALPALAAAGRPAIMVLRFDGRVDGLRDAEIHARIAALRDSWQQAGIALAGVKSTTTAPPPSCRRTRFLAGLRARWIRPSPVHHRPADLAGQSRARRPARHPRRKRAAGPCRAQSDARTVRCQARRPGWTPTRRRPASPGAWPCPPTAVASPGTTRQDRSGRSEQPALMPGGRSAELLVTPADMAAFVSRIEDRRPPGLAGIVWFRLPTRVDARAWSLPTWRAVLRASRCVRRCPSARRPPPAARATSYSRTPAMPTPRSPSPCGWSAGARRRRHQRLHAGTRRTRHLPASRAGRPAARRRPTQHRLDTL